MKIYLDNNLGVTNVEQEELTQDTIGYNILKVYIPNAVLTPYDTFTCYYGALLQNGRKVGWFAMEARTSSDADYEANYTLYKATLEQCVVSVEGKVYIGCQVLLGNSGNATLIKKNTAVVQFNVRKSVAINNDILVLDPDQTTTDVLESYKNLLENALLTYATKAEIYTKAQVDALLLQKADKSDTYTKSEVYNKTEANALLDTKADKSTTYTKTQVDSALATKADRDATDSRFLLVESAIDDLTSVQNVVDVVATKSALQSYDTSKLEANDKVQVIADETHNGASTIYNWNGSAWQYVGAYGTNAAPKSTALTHTGNQLQDYSGNNIYPVIATIPEVTTEDYTFIGGLTDGEDITSKLQLGINKGGIIIIASETPKTVIVSSTLYIKDNTTIFVYDSITIKKDDNVNAPIFTNYDTNNGNKNIKLIGGTYDFNRLGNTNYAGFGFLFNNVDNLTYKNLTLLNETKYCSLVCNCDGFIADNITFNTHSDGIHFQPPLNNAYITNIKGTTGDDMIAFTLGDYSSYEITNTGDFTNIVIDGVFGVNAKSLIKITGAGANANNVFKNIQINNLNGTVTREVVSIIEDNLGGNTHLLYTAVYGVTISNCSVSGASNQSYLLDQYAGDVTLSNIMLSGQTTGISCKNATSLNIFNVTCNSENEVPLCIAVSGIIEQLNIENANINNTNGTYTTKFLEIASTAKVSQLNISNVTFVGKKANSDFFVKINHTSYDFKINLTNVNIKTVSYIFIINNNLIVNANNFFADDYSTGVWTQANTPTFRLVGEGIFIFTWYGTFSSKSLNSRTFTLPSYKKISEMTPTIYDMVISTKSGEEGLYCYNGSTFTKLV